MKIGLLGDVHGHADWTVYALSRLHEAGVELVIQLGDFGIWPNGQRFYKKVEAACKVYNIDLIVVPGNHEDYDQIEALPFDDDGYQILTPHVRLAVRGQRWEIGGRSFVAIGGGPSVDRTYRLERDHHGPNKSWWEQEAITQEDVDKTVAPGYADIVVAHDAPHIRAIDKRISGNPMGFRKGDLAYAEIGRQYMGQVLEGVRPELWLHGHYHFFVDDKLWNKTDGYDELTGSLTRVVGLNMEGSRESFAVLDLETMQIDLPALQPQMYHMTR